VIAALLDERSESEVGINLALVHGVLTDLLWPGQNEEADRLYALTREPPPACAIRRSRRG
jgi:hypothetical protein